MVFRFLGHTRQTIPSFHVGWSITQFHPLFWSFGGCNSGPGRASVGGWLSKKGLLFFLSFIYIFCTVLWSLLDALSLKGRIKAQTAKAAILYLRHLIKMNVNSPVTWHLHGSLHWRLSKNMKPHSGINRSIFKAIIFRRSITGALEATL